MPPGRVQSPLGLLLATDPFLSARSPTPPLILPSWLREHLIQGWALQGLQSAALPSLLCVGQTPSSLLSGRLPAPSPSSWVPSNWGRGGPCPSQQSGCSEASRGIRLQVGNNRPRGGLPSPSVLELKLPGAAECRSSACGVGQAVRRDLGLPESDNLLRNL